MLVEIKGIGIPNKGAELMLVAIQQAFQDFGVGAHFVSEPYTDYLARARYGLLQKAWFELKRVQVGGVANLVPRRILQKFGIVTDRDVDVILDASGFAYGDQWGAYKIRERLGKHIKSWRRQGKQIILLPQAFGPFEDAEVKAEMLNVLDHVDLVFARDRVSLAHLQRLRPDSNRIRFAPDFTNLVRGSPPVQGGLEHYDICFIPNHKMIEMRVGESERYPAAMAQLIEVALRQNREPCLLIHEGQKDLDLANHINQRLSQQVPVLTFNDPLEIKAVIGSSNLVVSSRFHGLVSALSQSVPVVATGWSHKYQELLEDYRVPEYLVDHTSPTAEEQLKSLFVADRYNQVKTRIAREAANQKAQTRSMWQEVFTLMQGNQAAA
ncbi:MAG: polysaccharide pyruvyl transferase family protein [Pseudomonadota bacterium]|nr:polysaccharide pyruvyl transferase family protein [Pseudomonadota bacterium]